MVSTRARFSIENDKCKILWDFTVQTDHIIQARRPDMIVIDKETNKAQVIDFAIPHDSRVDSKEIEKIEKNQDLVRELKRLWDMKVVVIPKVLGALGTTPIHCRIGGTSDTAEKNEGHWH